MNKFFYFAALFFLNTSCDLSKNQTEETATNTASTVTNKTTPADATNGSGTVPANTTAPVQNVQSQVQQQAQSPAQAAIPAPNVTPVKMSIYGTWVLHAFNSTIQDKTEYPRGLPYMTIDSASKKFSGFAGCNGVDGSFEISGNQIIISALTKGDIKCDKKSEEAFMSFFSGKTQGFEFIQNFLYFRGAEGKNFTFRKIQ